MLGFILSVATIPGFAATLGGLGSKKLGSDDAVVSACDTNGFTVGYTTVAGLVTHVNLGGIADPGCEGGLLSLVLANSSGTSVGSASLQTVPTDGDTADNSMAVPVSPTPAAGVVSSIHVVITGP